MIYFRNLALTFLLATGLTESGAPPEMFAPGVVSTGDMELNAAFTPDGKTVFFTKRTPKFQQWIIVYSQLRAGRWTEPTIAPFSGTAFSDYDPFVSSDGRHIFFSSNRPTSSAAKRDFDIWVSDKTASGWSAPRNLGPVINSSSDDAYPTVTADGTIYFTAVRDGGRGRGDIYRSRLINGEYTVPENAGDSINSTFTDGDPYISPDENTLIFVSYGRPDGLGDGDIYVSHRSNGGWSKAVNAGTGVNSSALDFCPIVSPDGKRFFFTSERTIPRGSGPSAVVKGLMTYKQFTAQIRSPGNGFGDIYSVDAARIMHQ